MLDNFLRKYFMMGSQNCPRDPVAILEEALKGGITAFQFREKGVGALTGKERVVLGKQLRALCAEYQVPFFVNDDVELMEMLQADGIHVGQTDISVAALRIAFPNLLIGLSVSNETELKHSPIQLVDYVGAGPIYRSTSKDNAKDVVGLEWISFLRKKHPYLPIVGVGGVTTENAGDVLAAGANGVAVISAITMASNIKEVIERL
jgi:thiamine-phosphate pyrophosphorylase